MCEKKINLNDDINIFNKNDTFKQYCIVQIDRWPCCNPIVDGNRIMLGQYGDTYICDADGYFLSIESCDSSEILFNMIGTY